MTQSVAMIGLGKLGLPVAEAMAKHDCEFEGLAKDLADNESKIIDDLIKCQGTPIDIGGYYKPDPVKTERAMRPSETFNNILGN